MSQPTPSTPTPTTSSPTRKPRISLAIATAFGLGYLPKAPGTWGSLGGVAISLALRWWFSQRSLQMQELQVGGNYWTLPTFPESMEYLIVIAISLLGVFVANQVAAYSEKKDPQIVVIDEVSGQMITYFLPLTVLNWKSFILGFILFRVFDIWKPFPARQAEALPGGWGIMADDWIAGIYAALGLWIARALGM